MEDKKVTSQPTTPSCFSFELAVNTTLVSIKGTRKNHTYLFFFFYYGPPMELILSKIRHDILWAFLIVKCNISRLPCRRWKIKDPKKLNRKLKWLVEKLTSWLKVRFTEEDTFEWMHKFNYVWLYLQFFW